MELLLKSFFESFEKWLAALLICNIVAFCTVRDLRVLNIIGPALIAEIIVAIMLPLIFAANSHPSQQKRG